MADDRMTSQDSDVYKTLLESTKAIPWRIDWKTMCFTYIGPQIEKLLGWSVESWQTVNEWAERMHPEDQQWVVDFCVAQSKAGVDHEADYRALTKDGHYVWIRDVVHVIRDQQGEVEALIGFMFDITERKETEQKLLDLQKELEELSFKDGLTGVPNRRMLDKVFEEEWMTARRHQLPLSLLVMDIDFFKQYNDCYGHIQGDDCLKQVAQALSSAATRSRDFFARFGGEEFVMLLPETDASAAIKIAERCQQLMMKLQISHQESEVSQLLTISIGLGTIVPSPKDEIVDFVEQVDQALYRAKECGRNRVKTA
ncbi:MAG: sensor domain-containing diguanylate cyclase [Methylophaga sp.]|uniref:GGDEF domain-containing protein n=1 Tax=Methylophaga sp. UBA678 TaxID=1946901 RepID=UPI000C39FEBD|nr:sensor domain-containing diguanylate cyclase [Methylophaga sp. UBA678]MAX52662.1 sensor domain-containing diguanylate cyclase [Methylophaga sp.]|tara:strand:+ start:314056 stop:314991 length:936 start_codon:yes stop_codon:yes gene_type:complete